MRTSVLGLGLLAGLCLILGGLLAFTAPAPPAARAAAPLGGFTPSPTPNTSPTATSTATLTCGLAWRSVPSPNQGMGNNELLAVAAASDTALWAVGSYDLGGPQVGLILHWDGGAWTTTTITNAVVLNGVTAVSANEAWAVGNLPGTGGVIVHGMDGVWTPVLNPATSGELHGVFALAANNVWAVGYSADTPRQTLTLHWDGLSWTRIPSPNGVNDSVFYHINGPAANDLWAVGSSGPPVDSIPLKEHWDGATWTIVYGPDLPGGNNLLRDVTAPAANAAWATGYRDNFAPILLHWDGTAWTLDTSGAHGLALASSSPNNVWLVGNGGQTWHWNGVGWTLVPIPNPSNGSILTGAAMVGPNSIWAAGLYMPIPGPSQTLVEHYSGPCVTPSPSPSPSPSPIRTCGPAWRIVPTPDPDSGAVYLAGVAAASDQALWAVGTQFTDHAIYDRAGLILHWNGSDWTSTLITSTMVLSGVAAISDTEAWVVGGGDGYGGGGAGGGVLLHGVGGTWTRVDNPVPESTLTGVFALAANDVWAVGTEGTSSLHTLSLHWDGSRWTQIPSPDVKQDDMFYRIAGSGPHDLWAVGESGTHYNNFNCQTLIAHWDGTTWTVVPSPSLPGGDNHLLDITAPAPDAAWATGYAGNVGPILLHWDGVAWTLDTSGASGQGLASTSPTNVWLVGERDQTWHWDGQAWTLVPAPTIGSSNTLTSATMVGPDSVWAAGSYIDIPSNAARTLVEHYGDPCVTPSPSPSPSPPATVCPVQFQDVGAGDAFYPFIRCLACRGIISGYTCGGAGEPCVPPANLPYFRTTNLITRSQVSKLVALAAGLGAPIPSGQQTFEDVLPSHPFWVYIERLATAGYISGYPCGAPGEPCPPNTLFYFRPYANITRGQLAKIDANSAQYGDAIPSGQQTFEDVPPANPFWLYIERVNLHGVISGYACGGVGEPCTPPGNRPYFRTFASATRGQTTKIVANTFYPGCQTPGR